MKYILSVILCISFLLSTQAQDIFVFKDGSVRTGYSYFQDMPDAVQVADGSGRTFPIKKSSLSYIQRVTGQQLVFDNEKHPLLTLIDLQAPEQEKCYQHTGAMNAAVIDNQTPGKKATVTGAQVMFFRDECLMSKVQAYLAVGDVVTVERVAAIDTPGFTGSYLVSFISKSGIVFKGWVRKTNFVVETK
jgi:hypothetical protein